MKDFSGQRFGRLIAVRPTLERKRNCVVWECLCDCGNTHLVSTTDLIQGKAKSCGCLKKEWAVKHGEIRRKNLTGQRFGLLTAIRPTDKRVQRSVIWECKCDCGNTVYASVSALEQGLKKSCGCTKKAPVAFRGLQRPKDMTGERYGALTVVRPTDQRQGGSVVWECLCDCGKTVFASRTDLVHHGRQSCGCIKVKKETPGRKCEDLTGQRFGKLMAIELTEEKKRGRWVWRCKCDCGNTVYIDAGSLKSGNTKSCGCLRKKRYKNNTAR